jgi:hypothetical protein
MTSAFAAPGPMAGYLYQVRYALVLAVRTARRRSGLIGIETLDDVAFDQEGTPTELFQLKHTLNRKATLGDMSVDLWSAFRVWLASAADDDVLHLVTTATAPVGGAAWALRRGARNLVAADAHLISACETSTNATTREVMDQYAAMDRGERLRFLGRIEVIDAQPIVTDLKEALSETLEWAVKAPFLDALITRLEGWWLDRCLRNIVDREPITTDDLSHKIDDLSDQLRDDNLPIDDVEELLSDVGDTPEVHLERIFVTQLQLVDVSERRLLLAIRDWMRASAQRSRWMREQLLTPVELDRYERRLTEEWEHLFYEMVEELDDETAAIKVKAAGRKLYRTACQVLNVRPRERCDEPFVLRGSLHVLADQARVGWHRDFGTLVTEGTSEAAS